MKGLLLYYWYTLKNRFIMTMVMSVFIAVISIIGEIHVFAILYFIFSLVFLTSYDKEAERIKNSIMEDVLPLENNKIIGSKYILLLFLLLLGILFTLIYSVLVLKFFDSNYDYKYMINTMWSFVACGISIGSLIILSKYIHRDKGSFYLMFLIPIIQLVITFYLPKSKLFESLVSQENLMEIMQIITLLLAIGIGVFTFWKSIDLKKQARI